MPTVVQLLVSLSGGLLVAVLLVLVGKIISNRWSLIEFRKLSRGLPISSRTSLLGNHINSYAFGHDNCREILEEHAKLGPTYGVVYGDRFMVSTIDLDLIKRIIVDEGHLHLDRMSLNLPLREYEESIMLLPRDQWKPVRRIFAPALKSNKFKTPNVLHEIEESIGKLIGHIERQLAAQAEPAHFWADDFVHKYTLDLVFSCFYKQYQAIDFDDPKELWTGLIDSMLHQVQSSPMVRLSMIFPWFRRVVDWLMWHFHEQGFARQKVLEFVKRQTKLGMDARRAMKARREQGEKSTEDESSVLLQDGTKYTRNLIDGIIDAFLDGKLTASDYFNSSCFLLAAADKTASDSIVHTLYLLCSHPEVQERLRECIKADGADSEYLGWVLLESLRLLPPAPVGCSRAITRSIELESGHVLPAGTFVVTNAYAIHHQKKYWGEDADDFRPERWRDTSQHHPMQFLAFGAGQRGCIGREFALFQMKMLFAALLTRYRFGLAKPRDDAYKFNAPCLIFVIPNSPTIVTIRRLDDEA